MNKAGFCLEDTGGNNSAYNKDYKRSFALITKKDDTVAPETVAPETVDDAITVSLMGMMDETSGGVLFSVDFDKAIYFLNNSELLTFLDGGTI